MCILLLFSGNTAVARLLGEIQFIACRHPSYALLKRSHQFVSLSVAKFIYAMVITFLSTHVFRTTINFPFGEMETLG